MLEAKAYRQRERGEEPLDVEAELGRLLDERTGGSLGGDSDLREEVRQLVVARNERRARKERSRSTSTPRWSGSFAAREPRAVSRGVPIYLRPT